MSPIDFNGLDTTVHGPIRLGVMTALKLDGPHDFTSFKKKTRRGGRQLRVAVAKA